MPGKEEFNILVIGVGYQLEAVMQIRDRQTYCVVYLLFRFRMIT